MKKLSIKLICVLMAIIMVVPLFVQVMAAEDDGVEVIRNSRYGYIYTEYTDENYITIRTYKKNDSSGTVSAFTRNSGSASGYMSQEQTKALLSDLGMGNDFIEVLSEEDLAEYADSEEIYSMVSYTKTDAEGNISNVSEAEALEAAATYAIHIPDVMDGGYPSYSTEETDSYMTITFVVSYQGDGYYKFSVDALWLTMPFWRSFDSLGVCAQNMTVENSTRSAWQSYTMTQVTNHVSNTYSITEDLNDGEYGVKYQNDIQGNWYGSAVVFPMPLDSASPYGSTSFRDLKIHYEYIGSVTNPNQVMRFNTTASYCHTRYIILATPSVNIDGIGSSVAIAITVNSTADVRTAEFDSSIEYNP